MATISRQTIELIRSRCDIVDVVSSYLPLHRAGSSFRALCPFHKEKTPSFHVNPARQIYHCFGCGAGGDVIRFVMEYERLDFVAAVRMLAGRAGVPIELDERERVAVSQRARLLALHEAATAFFQAALAEAADAEAARRYLRERRLDGEAARRFRIGWAPGDGDALLRWGARSGWSAELLEAAGLAVRTEDGLRDRFRRRVMFPICDEQGRPIAFSGRILPDDQSPAKYLNSPETPLFQKGRVLYALHFARRRILETRRAVLCEGQIDALRCQLAGIEVAVAAQGTAVTPDHARTLRRYADEVVVMLDADLAGEAAAVRTAKTLLQEDLAVRVAVLPAGEDPDSLIVRAGAEAVTSAIEAAMPVVDFVVRVAAGRGQLRSDAGRRRLLGQLMELVGAIASPAMREQMLLRIAQLLGVTPAAMRDEFDGWRRRHEGRAEPGVSEETEAAPAAPPPDDELQTVEIALHHPECRPLLQTYARPELISHPVLRRVYERVLAAGEGAVEWPPGGEDADFERLVARLEMSDRALALRSPEMRLEAARGCVLQLWRNHLSRRRQELLQQAAVADGTRAEELRREAQVLTLQIRRLREKWERAVAVLELIE
ncbi:MAG: DNA primase [Kiritimatiellae bacterium]|nr:DNA primase [Kiritimatiellia bacterium]